MLIEWLTSEFITTRQALKSRLTTAEFRSMDKKNMLAEAKDLRAVLLNENSLLGKRKSYIGSQLMDIVTNKVK